MTSWISATGRTIGILICSAMLLVSATLGQSGRVSPPASFSLEAVQASNSQAVESSQANTDTSAEPASGTPVPEAVPQNPGSASQQQSAPQQSAPQQPTTTEPPSAPPAQPIPQAGSGFVPPKQDLLRFNKAVPVRMAPVRIQIPKAWVDADIQTVGVTPEGEMESPDDFWEVGWYRYGARPGDAGKSVMAGHLDSQDGAAVFYFIGDLQPGDDIRILLGGPDGERFYKVREVATYHVGDAPLDKIFGPSDTSELILITCGGEWRGSDGGYDERTVVYADLVVAGE